MLKVVFAGLILFVSSFANAGLIYFKYDGTWSSFNSGDFGSTYVATLIFDNGGDIVENQSFGLADFVSANVSSGSYDFTMFSVDIDSWAINFNSNASGQLTGGWFDASNGVHSWHYDPSFGDASFSDDTGSAYYFESNISNAGQVIPEPSTLAIFALSILGLASSRVKYKFFLAKYKSNARVYFDTYPLNITEYISIFK